MKDKSKYIGIVMFAVLIWAGVSNFNAFLMGNSVLWKNALISIIYVGCWYTFIWMSKENKTRMTVAAVWNVLTILCVIGAMMTAMIPGLNVSFMIPLVTVCMSPLYGLDFFLRGGLTIFTTIIASSCLGMSMMFLTKIKQKARDSEKAAQAAGKKKGK